MSGGEATGVIAEPIEAESLSARWLEMVEAKIVEERMADPSSPDELNRLAVVEGYLMSRIVRTRDA